MPSLDSVTFDDTGLQAQGEQNGVRIWHTPAGDGVGLYFFNLPPNIEADISDLDAVRAFYRDSVTAAGLGLIEVETFQTDGCAAVRTIFKAPQQSSGMTYIGSLTLPFRDFSYVVKVQCAEHGVTGTREAVILNTLMASGQITLNGSVDGKIPGWMQDPYDPKADAPLLRNLAEDEQYDAQFPEHPLSRVRSVLRQVQPSLRVAPEVKNAPSFVFAAPLAKRPWWKKW